MTYRDKYIEEFGKEPDLFKQCPYENLPCDACPIYDDSFKPCWEFEIVDEDWKYEEPKRGSL